MISSIKNTGLQTFNIELQNTLKKNRKLKAHFVEEKDLIQKSIIQNGFFKLIFN